MENNEIERARSRELEVSLKQLLSAIWHRAWLVLVVGVLAAAFMLLITANLITPQYQASATFYVNNTTTPVTQTSGGISSSDITAAKSLVDSYIVILTTRESLNPVVEHAGLNLTYEQVRAMISASSVNSTEFFKVVVTGDDPQVSYKLAHAITEVLPDRISSIIEGSSAEVVEYPVVPSEPSSPNVMLNTIVGFLIGAFAVVIYILLRELFDISIRSEEDITALCSYPILTEVPDMTAPNKGGYYSRSSPKKQANSKNQPRKESGLFGDNLDFTSSEAYKLLRTKLQFSFADEGNCRVIGLVSALAGEGKSLTASNLAYTMAQLDKRVLLIEGDMRRPSLSSKMPIRRTPGLSNYLTGQARLEDLIQTCHVSEGKVSFHVIAAGRTPPNPVELLSAPKMANLIESLRSEYDYIIIDLPPIGEVSDALVAGKHTDGLLVVVRQHYCNRISLSDVVHQIDFVDARVLGVVFNCKVEHTHSYGRKYYYGRKYAYGKYAYSKSAYGRHARSYAAAAEKAKRQTQSHTSTSQES